MTFDQFSYIRRRGRMTKSQARGMQVEVDRYRVELQDIAARVSAADTVGVEIGFGMGHNLIDWGVDCPTWQLFGIELYQPGIGSLADNLQKTGVGNVHVIQHPAQIALEYFPPHSVKEVRVFFPDPWPKKRHWRRRLIQPEFLELLARVLQAEGLVRLATDWQPYAEWMRECFSNSSAFINVFDEVRPAGQGAKVRNGSEAVRDATKFEQRGERLGHDTCDLVYCRTTQTQQ